jgi:hypothetical protein
MRMKKYMTAIIFVIYAMKKFIIVKKIIKYEIMTTEQESIEDPHILNVI